MEKVLKKIDAIEAKINNIIKLFFVLFILQFLLYII